MTSIPAHQPPSSRALGPTARLKEAFAIHQQGDHRRAEGLYLQVLAESPRSFDAMHLLGVALTQRGAYAEGVASIRGAIALDGRQLNARYSLVRALLDMRDAPAALLAADELIALEPRSAEAQLLRGNAHQQLAEHERALECFALALRLDPGLAAVFNNRGHSLRMLRRLEEALTAFAGALALRPGYAMALNNQGLTFFDLQRAEDALRSFDGALVVQPDTAEFLSNRGAVLLALKRFDAAAADFERLSRIAPQFGAAVGNLLYARRNDCDWTDYDELAQRVTASVRRGELADAPVSFLGVCDDPALQLQCARTYAATRYSKSRRFRPLSTGGRRIRVAYLSGDFGEHAVSYLLTGVFEQHDRRRFEIIAVSWGRRNDGAARARLESAFDQFMDVTGLSDMDVVARLRELEVDIAVDLMGHSGGQRTEILARGVAPVQVNYLGYPGSMGMPQVDYIVADAILIPAENRGDFSEEVMWLPDCFQANDSRRVIDQSPITRVEVGLPRDGFVWCSFHASHKLNPKMFDVWVRLVRETPASVLWLLGGNPRLEANLRREATVLGLDPDRLVFATPLPYARHLARLRLADLCLDTLPFNGGATSSDALWAGLPILTCMGRSFAARMTGSLLQSLGLSDLVTNSLSDYERVALQLAREPGRLAALRLCLEQRRLSSPLFDTRTFCRRLEAVYEIMVARERARAALPSSAEC